MRDLIHFLKFYFNWHRPKLLTYVSIWLALLINNYFLVVDKGIAISIATFASVACLVIFSRINLSKGGNYQLPISFDFYGTLPVSRSSIKLMLSLDFLISVVPILIFLYIGSQLGLQNFLLKQMRNLEILVLCFMCLLLILAMLVAHYRIYLSAPYQKNTNGNTENLWHFVTMFLIRSPVIAIYLVFGFLIYSYKILFGYLFLMVPVCVVAILNNLAIIDDEKMSYPCPSKLIKKTFRDISVVGFCSLCLWSFLEQSGSSKKIIVEIFNDKETRLYNIIKNDQTKELEVYLKVNQLENIDQRFTIIDYAYKIPFLNLSSLKVASYGSLMSYAAYLGATNITIYLYKKGYKHDDELCHTDLRCQKINALTIAALRSHNFTSSFLVKQGANPNIAIKHGKKLIYPIQMAANKCNKPLIKILSNSELTNLNVVDEKGNTPLMATVLKKCPVVASIIIGRGADLSIKNKQGESFYDLAQKQGYPELIKFASSYHDRLPASTPWVEGLQQKKE